MRKAQLNHDELRFGWLAEAVDEIERLRADNERLREVLRDIAVGDYSDPFCKRTPEGRARDALEGGR